jgi:hypothetical protein
MVLTCKVDYSLNAILQFQYSFSAYYRLDTNLGILCGWSTVDGSYITFLEMEGACTSERAYEFIKLGKIQRGKT